LTHEALQGIFISSLLRVLKEDTISMSIRKLSPNRWFVRVRVRSLQGGKILSRVRVLNGTYHEARKIETELHDELVKGKKVALLKIRTFGEALRYYRENSSIELSHVGTLFNKLERDLGSVFLVQLAERFTSYWTLLKNERSKRTGRTFAVATRNRLLMYGKIALNFCKARGLIESNPLDCFSKLPEQGRDRVLTEEECGRIMAIMKRRNSYLYWPFCFSFRNPVRRGDLTRLTRENLDWFRPWIHFYPSKTRSRKPRETCLPFLDEPLLTYLKTVPEGGLLFPRIDRKGGRHPLGDFINHWHSILEEAGIKDFHWHDLKHCAITWMLDNGYSERDLKNLGIQYSPAMIDRYYHADASKVLTKWKRSHGAEGVAHGCGSFAENSVKFG
jgi:integrase